MASEAEIQSCLQRLADVHVTCVGDLMLDRFVQGWVHRVSPEAPVPVLRVIEEHARLGGVGNVVRNVLGLGARAACLGAVGEDEAGREVAALLGAESRCQVLLVACAARPTTTKTRFVAGGQQLLRADAETTGDLPAAAVRDLAQRFTEAIEQTDIVVVSDYAKGVLTDALIDLLVTRARRAGKAVIVDPKNADLARYAEATLLTPNASELALASGRACSSDEDVVAAADQALARCRAEAILVTRSSRGMTLVRRNSAPVHFPADVREVFDVTGAGDTVAATLAVLLAAGASLETAARVANVAAGLVVGKVGTAVVTQGELRDAVEAARSVDARELSLAPTLEQVARWRARGLRIGFTNGCFDLLHPGHLALLRAARSECDRLVVGLNSDASTRRLKGPLRPIQDAATRSAMLSALRWVDAVVVFEEDTPADLIASLRPDLLVKGGDYSADTVVGGDFVRSTGGAVKIVPLVELHSSSDIIATIRERQSRP
jgi:D-beta-D-heptose 7-phosphate kinase/D-beta-D-heptose 1-phosphate adenosyltransferase